VLLGKLDTDIQQKTIAEILKQVQMTNYRVSRISKRCRAHHDFLKVPLIVIPNLFRDLFFEGIYDDESVNLQS